MAKTTSKPPLETVAPPETEPLHAAPDFDIESAIADELLDSIDWAKVRSALLKKAPAKLFAWLTSGNNTPINLSPYPELAALPSRDSDRESAA